MQIFQVQEAIRNYIIPTEVFQTTYSKEKEIIILEKFMREKGPFPLLGITRTRTGNLFSSGEQATTYHTQHQYSDILFLSEGWHKYQMQLL